MIISVIASVINSWIHTLQSDNESLISQAYWEHLNNHSMKSPWICFVKNILTDLGFSHVWDNQGTFNASSLVVCIKAKLKERFISYWKKCMKSEAGMDKLRTYKLIKHTFEIEQYLEILPDRKQRKSLAAFRISAHKLQIDHHHHHHHIRFRAGFPLPRVGLFDKSSSKTSSPLRAILRVSRVHI